MLRRGILCWRGVCNLWHCAHFVWGHPCCCVLRLRYRDVWQRVVPGREASMTRRVVASCLRAIQILRGHLMVVGMRCLWVMRLLVCSSTVSVLGVLAILSVIRLRLQQSRRSHSATRWRWGLEAGLRLELVDLFLLKLHLLQHQRMLCRCLLGCCKRRLPFRKRCLVQHCRTVAICLRHSCSVYYGLLLAPRRRPLWAGRGCLCTSSTNPSGL